MLNASKHREKILPIIGDRKLNKNESGADLLEQIIDVERTIDKYYWKELNSICWASLNKLDIYIFFSPIFLLDFIYCCLWIKQYFIGHIIKIRNQFKIITEYIY